MHTYTYTHALTHSQRYQPNLSEANIEVATLGRADGTKAEKTPGCTSLVDACLGQGFSFTGILHVPLIF